MKKKLKAIWLRLKGYHICEHEGCLNIANQCSLDVYDTEGDYHWIKEAYYWYCPDHCRINGFCYGCGQFWGGCESFDFSPSGLCPNCKDELDNELESDFDDEMADFYSEIF